MVDVSLRETYGGWLRRRQMGLLGLGTIQTLVLLGIAALVLLVAAVDAQLLLVLGLPLLVVLGVTVARWDGEPDRPLPVVPSPPG